MHTDVSGRLQQAGECVGEPVSAQGSMIATSPCRHVGALAASAAITTRRLPLTNSTLSMRSCTPAISWCARRSMPAAAAPSNPQAATTAAASMAASTAAVQGRRTPLGWSWCCWVSCCWDIGLFWKGQTHVCRRCTRMAVCLPRAARLPRPSHPIIAWPPHIPSLDCHLLLPFSSDFGLAEELTPAVRHHFISFLHMISRGESDHALAAAQRRVCHVV